MTYLDPDPRHLSDAELFRYHLIGDIPKAGWSPAQRRRAIAKRLLYVAWVFAFFVTFLVAMVAIVLFMASVMDVLPVPG